MIKKELPPITEEEIPFEIPENWCWCRLGKIVDIFGGKRIPAGRTLVDYDTGHKYIKVADMKNHSVLVKNLKYLPEDIYQVIKKYTISKNDLYITVAGTIGDVGIIPDEIDNANLTENADKLVFSNLDKKWLMYSLLSNCIQSQIRDSITKVGQPKLAIIRIQNLLIPLPPLAVQNAIVAKLEQVLPLVDAYENAVFRKEELKGALKDKVKKAVLQEAIQGRLVLTLNTSFGLPGKDPSCPQADTAKTRGIDLQTGTELLEQIRAEKKKLIREGKLKKEKPLPEITEDEIPFNVPENWCWCRLGEIVELTSGQDLPPSSYNNKNIGIPYLTGASNFSNESIIINRWTETPKAIALKNDLLLTCKGTVGEMAFLTEEKVHIARQIMSLRTDENISLKYIKCFLYSQIEILKSKAKSMIPGIAREDIIMLVMPLPPLAEQKRIVAAIEELLPLCEKLGE